MKSIATLSETWIRASVLGTTWAASEIVLGSFVHNLRIPFGSNLLTGIGIVILISSAYIWRERGLFWRAGLICALMKSMSPSAVIFGPMVAIFSEGILLEASVRLAGRNIAGFILGGMLAMSWNLFHKIINFIIFYGFNIVDIYAELVRYAQKQFRLEGDLVWTPVLALLAVYCLLGLISALIGIRVGKRLLQRPPEQMAMQRGAGDFHRGDSAPPVRHSIAWLIADLLLFIGGMVVLNLTPWYVWIPATLLLAALWVWRYRRTLRRLSSPRFWFWFVVITMLAAAVFGGLQTGSLADALMTGVRMNFRAVIVILGFSALGVELSNPVIRDLFLRTSFRQLPLALELSFESLPVMIATVPDGRTLLREPVSALYGVLSQIEFRLADMKRRLERRILIISGPIRSGKTTYTGQVAEALKSGNIAVGGIVSPRIMESDETTGYDISDLRTGHREPFLRLKNDTTVSSIGRFEILDAGLYAGTDALTVQPDAEPDVVIIDEIGRLELEGKGWAGSLETLLSGTACHLVLAIRDTFTEEVIRHWKLRNVTIVGPWQAEPRVVAAQLVAAVS